jgi:hypothetical protein
MEPIYQITLGLTSSLEFYETLCNEDLKQIILDDEDINEMDCPQIPQTDFSSIV